jgi:hypothetical protein
MNPSRRVILVKPVLSSFPIFQFSSLHAPVGIKKEMAKLIRKFIWQGENDNRKNLHMVNSSTVYTPK